MSSWTAEVIADERGVWRKTTMYFATKEEAERYAMNLKYQWAAVRDTRVVPSTKPVTFTLNKLTPLNGGDGVGDGPIT